MPTLEVGLATKIGSRSISEVGSEVWVPYDTTGEGLRLKPSLGVPNSEFRPAFFERRQWVDTVFYGGLQEFREGVQDAANLIPANEWALPSEDHLVHQPQFPPGGATPAIRRYTLAYGWEKFSFENAALFWRWLPRRASSFGYVRIDAYQYVDVATDDPWWWVESTVDDRGTSDVYAFIDDFNTVVDATLDETDFDPTEPIWFRFRHDAGTNTAYIEWAQAAGTWAVLVSLALQAGAKVGSCEVEVLSEVRWSGGDTSSTSTRGFLGPWNPEPRELAVGLATQIGDMPVLGSLGVDVLLSTQIGD